MEKRINSKTYTKSLVIKAIAYQLTKPGEIRLIDIWPKCKTIGAYFSIQVAFRSIMLEMIDAGRAKEKKRGCYEILGILGYPHPEKIVNVPLQRIVAYGDHSKDKKVEFVRPPAKYDNPSHEEILARYGV